ncbi:MAG: YbaK/EbsC family protein, partial [Alphaproteobacteria bacterium]
MSNLENSSVQRVCKALTQAGSPAEVIELSETARSAQDAADSIVTELGSIVKSLVFAGLGAQGVRLGAQGVRLGALGARLGAQGVRLGAQGVRL